MNTPQHNKHSDEWPGARLWLGLVLLLAALLYLPGVNGPWLHDDFGRLINNPDVTADEISIATLARSTHTYPERPLAMMTFAAAHALCGDASVCQKGPNVVLHLLTGIALFAFLTQLGRSGQQENLFTMPSWLPLAATALWVLHPLNVSTTLYAVQRMSIMAGLFTLLALLAWLHARNTAENSGHRVRQRLGWLLATIAFTLLGTLCKESAWLVPVYIGLLELLLLNPAHRARIPRPTLTAILVTFGFAGALTLMVMFPPNRLLETYSTREFTPPERLLTETRILLYYVSEIVYPDHERMSIFLDIFPLSRSLLDPWTTFAAVVLWLSALTACTAILLRRPSLAAFGILFFFTGHLLESTVYGLVLAYEHRNYLPSTGMLLALCALAAQLPRPQVTIPVLLMAGLVCAIELRERVFTWQSAANHTNFLRAPRWQASMSANVDIARYAAQLMTQYADDPVLARLHKKQSDKHFWLAAEAGSQNFLPLANLATRSSAAADRERAWDRLEYSAGHAALNPDALNAIGWLVTCTLAPDCPVDHHRLARVLDTLIANPRQGTYTRVAIQRYAGTFLVKIHGEAEKGIALSRTAAMAGGVDARESLIKNLAFLGRLEEARAIYTQLQQDAALNAEQHQRIEAALASPGVVVPGLAY